MKRLVLTLICLLIYAFQAHGQGQLKVPFTLKCDSEYPYRMGALKFTDKGKLVFTLNNREKVSATIDSVIETGFKTELEAIKLRNSYQFVHHNQISGFTQITLDSGDLKRIEKLGIDSITFVFDMLDIDTSFFKGVPKERFVDSEAFNYDTLFSKEVKRRLKESKAYRDSIYFGILKVDCARPVQDKVKGDYGCRFKIHPLPHKRIKDFSWTEVDPRILQPIMEDVAELNRASQ